jgi:amidohydrolase
MSGYSTSLDERERADLIALRRDFHRHPELGFQEARTAGVIAERLRALGLTPITGLAGTGVSAVIEGKAPGPTLMLRSDMDALPITEAAGHPHRSEQEGVMHACGHDGHMATLLAVCSALSREAGGLAGRVKAVFQPAEEGMDGAKQMIAAGVMDNPRVDAVLGLHYWSGLPTGQAAVAAGAIMAAVDDFSITLRGKGGHAALPHLAVDVVLAAAELVGALQSVMSRWRDPMEPAVLTVTELHAGSTFNVIPEEAVLRGTARSFDRKLWTTLPEHMERVIAGVCRTHGCEYTLDYRRVTSPVVNDAHMAQLVRAAAAEVVGESNVSDMRLLGGEDMSFYLERVPGCFFFVGSGNEAKGTTEAHHHPAFDLDEDALAIGAEIMLRAARRFLSG